MQMDLGDIDVKDSYTEANEILSTPKEGPHEVAAYEAAIDELDRKALIDRNRVGLTGFSRTAYHVLYTLTHSHYHFAAALVSDGVNFGYGNCVFLTGIGDDTLTVCERINGGWTPYRGSSFAWREDDPALNSIQIIAP